MGKRLCDSANQEKDRGAKIRLQQDRIFIDKEAFIWDGDNHSRTKTERVVATDSKVAGIDENTGRLASSQTAWLPCAEEKG